MARLHRAATVTWLAGRRSDSYVHSSAFPATSARPGSARYCQAHGLRPVSALVKLNTISHPIDPEGHRSGPQLRTLKHNCFWQKCCLPPRLSISYFGSNKLLTC